MEALRKVCAVLDMPCGKRLAPYLRTIVPILEHFKEFHLEEATRKKLVSMSAATIDRLLRADRKKMELKGRSGTKPGTLLKNQVPIRTWCEWDESRPGFLEIDLVGHEGGVSWAISAKALMSRTSTAAGPRPGQSRIMKRPGYDGGS